MEIKIGIVNSPREISLETPDTPDEVQSAVLAGLSEGGAVQFRDAKGRQLIVAADKLSYVDIGEPSQRRVGFGG